LSPEGEEKVEKDINLVVVWAIGEQWKKRYAVTSPLDLDGDSGSFGFTPSCFPNLWSIFMIPMPFNRTTERRIPNKSAVKQFALHWWQGEVAGASS
jgi:hypothetical protein